jgi:hypothetical protein
VIGVCRVCGCTDEAGCVIDADGELVEIVDERTTLPQGATICRWVAPDLCSACAVLPQSILWGPDGRPLGAVR